MILEKILDEDILFRVIHSQDFDSLGQLVSSAFNDRDHQISTDCCRLVNNDYKTMVMYYKSCSIGQISVEMTRKHIDHRRDAKNNIIQHPVFSVDVLHNPVTNNPMEKDNLAHCVIVYYPSKDDKIFRRLKQYLARILEIVYKAL